MQDVLQAQEGGVVPTVGSDGDSAVGARPTLLIWKLSLRKAPCPVAHFNLLPGISDYLVLIGAARWGYYRFPGCWMKGQN